MKEERVVLFRCPMPTNWLCPCGAVERRLERLGIEHRVERVAQRRGQRPEIVELTDQRRVPVLVVEDEVIADSRRILEHLDWRFGTGSSDEEDAPTDDPGEDDPEAAVGGPGRGLYNLKRWRRQRQQ